MSNRRIDGGFDDGRGGEGDDQLDKELRCLTFEDLSDRVTALEERQRDQEADYRRRVALLAENPNDAAIVRLGHQVESLRDLIECQHREDYQRLEGTLASLLDMWTSATGAIGSAVSVFRGRLREPAG